MLALRTDKSMYARPKNNFLELVGVEEEPAARRVQAPKRARRQMSLRALNTAENRDALFFAAAGLFTLIFLGAGAVSSLWRSAHAPIYVTGAIQPSVTVAVHPGDTLWKFANQYGDPNQYILSRIDSIARNNHLSAGAPLVPGQRLRIAVANPAELAKLPSHPNTVASLPR